MLFGDVKRNAEFHPGLKEIFNGQVVTFQNNKWDYGPARYWHIGQEHSFVALHPAYIQEIPGEITYSNSEISFIYETPVSDYKGTTDILVATHRRRKYTLDNAGAVKFGFKHILSRINIAPALVEVLMYPDETNRDIYPDNKDEYIQIHKIELHGLKTRASFSFASAPLQDGEDRTDKRTDRYEVDDNSVKTIVLDFPDNSINVTNNGEFVKVFDDDNALLILPQNVGSNVKAVLYYTVNGDHTENSPVRTATIPLSGIGKWETGKTYTYKFTIEKAYTGQIKAGSLKWIVEDSNITDPNAKDRWISEDDTIRQEFDIDDDE